LSSCKIPLVDLLHILSYIQPRYYTISSAPSYFPNSIHLTVSITQYKQKNGKQFTGLMSGFFQSLQSHAPGEGSAQQPSVRVFVRPSTFRLPVIAPEAVVSTPTPTAVQVSSDPLVSPAAGAPSSAANAPGSSSSNGSAVPVPVIMVGAGTGLAPMRALLQERRYQALQLNQKGKNVLIFGCKNKDQDYIYRDELEAHEREGVLYRLHTAFSRDSSAPKVYVQDKILSADIAVELAELIAEQGAFVYVCGNTSMGTSVLQAFGTIMQQHRNMSAGDAQNYIEQLVKDGRYVQELWTP
jgi:NADPH-ferrihemoprotein reductase